MGPFLDRVVGSGKASLIRGHLSRDMNEVRGQALHLSFSDKKSKCKGPELEWTWHALGTAKRPLCRMQKSQKKTSWR